MCTYTTHGDLVCPARSRLDGRVRCLDSLPICARIGAYVCGLAVTSWKPSLFFLQFSLQYRYVKSGPHATPLLEVLSNLFGYPSGGARTIA
jgi:hypothetical protein